jgi:hypothetical protein
MSSEQTVDSNGNCLPQCGTRKAQGEADTRHNCWKPSRRALSTHFVALTTLALPAALTSQLSHAQGYAAHSGLGFVLEADAEFGGNKVVDTLYSNGYEELEQLVPVGQGATLALGAHYKLPEVPLDFAATVGYKYLLSTDSGVNMTRVVAKFTGTFQLPLNFWVDAGPVWHTDTTLRGPSYDIDFGSAVGVTIGAGWQWVGVSYTNIKYNSPQTGEVDGSNYGITFTWKL